MTADAAAEIIQRANTAQQRGDLAAADAAFREALLISKDDSRALSGLGVLCYQTGRYPEAIQRLSRAVQLSGPSPTLLINLGLAQHASGNYDEAIANYREAIRAKPAFAPAHNSLGVSLLARERRDEALAAFTQAVTLDPKYARAYFNLGTVQRQKGDLSGAIGSFRRACANLPGFVQGYASLAASLQELGDWDGAVENYELARGYDANDVIVINNLSTLLIKRGDLGRARELLDRGVAAAPENATLLATLGDCLAADLQYDAAISVLQKALALDPKLKDAWASMGHVLVAQEQWSEAIGAYERAMVHGWALVDGYLHIAAILAEHEQVAAARALMEAASKAEPGSNRVLYRWGLVHLKRGELATGWDMYEKRFYDQTGEMPTFKKRPPTPPAYWEGEDLTGKSILVWREQGLGEEIMAASMLPDVIAKAKRCLVVGNARLERIYRRSFPTVEVHDFAKLTNYAATGCDFQISALSLGRFLRRDFSAFPKHAGYLKANPDKSATIREKYRRLAAGRRIVGIGWASKNAQVGNAKTGDLADWAPLLQSPDTWFVNLQYGDCRRALEIVRERTGVHVYQDIDIDPMGDLDDYFAQLSALDLMISTSNTGVHAAGALNVPTWVLLPCGRGTLWPWFEKREHSPWYASARLFRQPADAPRNEPWWREPVARAAAELSQVPFRP